MTANKAGGDAVSSGPPDPWSEEAMVLSQDFADTGETEDILTHVGLGRFSDQTFVRAHKEFRLRHIHVLKIKEDLQCGVRGGELFYVRNHMVPVLCKWVQKTELFTLISRQRAVKIWPVPMDLGDGRWNNAHKSATRALEQAMDRWVQIAWIGGEKGYATEAAKADYGEPQWHPNVGFPEIRRLAFEGHDIDSPQHPVANELLGRG
jgi:hypothetical protein